MMGHLCWKVSYKCSTLSFSMSFILSHCLCFSPCISNGSSTSITWFMITFFLNEGKAISPLIDKSLVSVFSFFLLFFNNVFYPRVLENDIGIEGFLTNVFLKSLLLGVSLSQISSSNFNLFRRTGYNFLFLNSRFHLLSVHSNFSNYINFHCYHCDVGFFH